MSDVKASAASGSQLAENEKSSPYDADEGTIKDEALDEKYELKEKVDGDVSASESDTPRDELDQGAEKQIQVEDYPDGGSRAWLVVAGVSRVDSVRSRGNSMVYKIGTSEYLFDVSLTPRIPSRERTHLVFR